MTYSRVSRDTCITLLCAICRVRSVDTLYRTVLFRQAVSVNRRGSAVEFPVWSLVITRQHCAYSDRAGMSRNSVYKLGELFSAALRKFLAPRMRTGVRSTCSERRSCCPWFPRSLATVDRAKSSFVQRSGMPRVYTFSNKAASVDKLPEGGTCWRDGWVDRFDCF